MLLADRNVNTFYAIALLVNDRINRNGGFTRLTVADDELALTATNWDHRVDRFDTGLHWLMYGFTCHNARSRGLNRTEGRCFDWTFAVYRLT
ncbi:hypothetical protein D3C73_1090790 [compost metagenome]